MKIKVVSGREILNSAGFPSLEIQLETQSGFVVSASIPAGTSTGSNEAPVLYDGDEARYEGKGLKHLLAFLEAFVAPALIGIEVDVEQVHRVVVALLSEHNINDSQLLLALEIATIKAIAEARNQPIYRAVAQFFGTPQSKIPRCFFNMINGGKHAPGGPCIQEFLIVPQKTRKVDDLLVEAVTIYHALKAKLSEKFECFGTGLEGGLVCHCRTKETHQSEELLHIVQQVLTSTGSAADVSLDCAANSFYEPETGAYLFDGVEYSSEKLLERYKGLAAQFGLLSIEDPFAEYDIAGWQLLHQGIGPAFVVGDDITTTNPTAIAQAYAQYSLSAVIIKPNQAGSLVKAREAVLSARKLGMKLIASHRSAETNDTFIADFAVGIGAYGLKAGAPIDGERVAKYNRLLEIAEELDRGL